MNSKNEDISDKETVGKAENATAKAVASRHRARGSAYGESKQERAMADQPHEHRAMTNEWLEAQGLPNIEK